MARPENEAGTVAAGFRMQHMVLLLKRDAEQQTALNALSLDLQNLHSPNYHHWLKPAEFAEHFGVSQNDVDHIANWLTSAGFQVEPIAAEHWLIKFSGTAAQVRASFHTAIHLYKTAKGLHYANADEPQIPQALRDVIAGVIGLNDFRPRSQIGVTPRFTGASGLHYVAPVDFSTIYGLYTSGGDGTGQTIAITAPCSVNLSVVQTYWNLYLGVNKTPTTAYYGNVSPCDSDTAAEVYSDLEWAGAVARGANILLVASDQGIGDAAYQAVQNQLAPVITTSYGDCEQNVGSSGNSYFDSLWQQAHVYGITSLVSAGDSGAAGCDDTNSVSIASQGLGVNAICSSQWATCVGGTEFNESTYSLMYWSGNALGYIPEIAWNESGLNGGTGIWAGGGGYSTIYPTPPWQSGNPAAMRGVPDVALTSAQHDAYVVCPEGNPSQCNNTYFYYAYGTSLSSPAFAGIMALVVQKTGQWQGSANAALYSIWANDTYLTTFNDVVSGNNNVPGQPGYSAAPGWDPVTGLGSVHVASLLSRWPVPPSTATISVTQLVFGDQLDGTSSAPQTFTITNNGPSALTFNISIPLGDYEAFPYTSTCSSATIPAGSSCMYSVTLNEEYYVAGADALVIQFPGNTWIIPLITGGRLLPPGSVSWWVPVSNQEVSDTPPSPSGCAPPPPAVTNLLATDNFAYLYFNAVVSPNTQLTSDWLAPTGQVFPGGNWAFATGSQCFSTSLSISGIASVPLGSWQARVFSNGSFLFSVLFTISAPASVAPVIWAGGIVNAASYGASISPGSLITIYGTNLATSVSPGFSFPLPVSWNGTQVTVAGVPAALLYVSPTQINAQVPFDAPIPYNGIGMVTVTAQGLTASSPASLLQTAPGIFADVNGQAIATHADGTLITRSSPASGGEEIILYGTGTGPLNVTPQTGGPAGPGASLSECTGAAADDGGQPTPTYVTIRGIRVTADFCGLTPGLAGLMQINVRVPPGLPAGDGQLVVEVGGESAQPVLLTVSP